jgi:hypothetical protein
MMSNGQGRGFTGYRSIVQCTNIVSIRKWKNTRDSSGDTLVEKDIEEKGRKNTPL